MLSARKLFVLFIVIAAPLTLALVDLAWNYQGALTPQQVTQLQILAIPTLIGTLFLPFGPWVVARRDSPKRGLLIISLTILYIVLSFGAPIFAALIVGTLNGSGEFTGEASDASLLWMDILALIGLAAYVAVIALACHSAVRLHRSKAVVIGVACALISAVLFVSGGALWPLWMLAMLLHAVGWTTILLVLFKNEPVTPSA